MRTTETPETPETEPVTVAFEDAGGYGTQRVMVSGPSIPLVHVGSLYRNVRAVDLIDTYRADRALRDFLEPRAEPRRSDEFWRGRWASLDAWRATIAEAARKEAP